MQKKTAVDETASSIWGQLLFEKMRYVEKLSYQENEG